MSDIICTCGRTEKDIAYSPCEDCGEYSSEENYVRPLDFHEREKQYDLFDQQDNTPLIPDEEEEDHE